MSQNLYKLDDTVAIEALRNRWPAWADLLSPISAALHVANYQVKILESYLSDPQVHEQACKDPTLLGGPYIDIAPARANLVADFLSQTRQREAVAISLAQSVKQTNDLLEQNAKGFNMAPLYEELDANIKGFVELVYDYHNRPIARYLESMLYKSKFHDRSLQAICLYRQIADGDRSFFLTTPRLNNDLDLLLEIPFSDKRVDYISQLISEPQPLQKIVEELQFTESETSDDFKEFLKPHIHESSDQNERTWRGKDIRIRYFGHACALIQCNGVSILTDPWIGSLSATGGPDRFTFSDLPDTIDYAVVTHAHHDHFVIPTLIRLRHKIRCLVVPKTSGIFYGDVSLKLAAQDLGFQNVLEVDSLDTIPVAGGEIIALPFLGEHADLPHSKAAYLVRFGAESCYFGADSDCLDEQLYHHLRHMVGKVNTAFIGMECVGAPLSWMYGPLLPVRLSRSQDASRRTKGCDKDAALKLLNALGTERVYIYALGREPWLTSSMGLSPADDSPQMLHSNAVLDATKQLGFRDSQRPFCKAEFHI